jgi:predicted GNAT family acetyltransferase
MEVPLPPDMTLVRQTSETTFLARLAEGAVAVAGKVSFHVTSDGYWRIEHTVVDPAFEGQGVGGFLAQGVLQAAQDEGVLVLPECSFFASYLARHPEYRFLVPEDLRQRYGL